jgi:hypothetical protein
VLFSVFLFVTIETVKTNLKWLSKLNFLDKYLAENTLVSSYLNTVYEVASLIFLKVLI